MSVKYNITIVSDKGSWMGDHIPNFAQALNNEGHSVKIIHAPEEIVGGDFVFFLSCGKIVPLKILSKNKHNIVVHTSDLPKGKGWSPLTWQILEGRNEIPVCLFEAAEAVDSGKIYLREAIKFRGTELINETRKCLADITIKMCLRFVHEYPSIVGKGVAQKGESTFYRRRTNEDSRLDPDKTIKEQFNLLRVVDNERYPAFFDLGDERYILRIEKATVPKLD